MNRPPHVSAIFDALASMRNRYTTEAALHHATATALARARIPFEWEHKLTARERIDFHVPGPPAVGIEIKVAGGEVEHLRQLYRYAPHYADLVLITTRASCPEEQELDTPGRQCFLHVLNLSLRL